MISAMKNFLMAVALCGLAGAAQAASVPIFGDGALGDFTGFLTYVSNSAGTQATLAIELTNTSPLANGGFLTAFALNVPTRANITVIEFSDEASPNSGPWQMIGGLSPLNSVSASPFGDYDLGGSITSSWLGNGGPQDGLAVGESLLFRIRFEGTGLKGLTTMSFLETPSTNGGPAFVARFRGFDDDGSDKVPGQVVPEPGTYAALLAGGVAVLAWRKRRA